MSVLKSVPVMAAVGAVAAQAAYSSSKRYRRAVGNDRTTAALYGAAGGAVLSVVAAYATPSAGVAGLGMHPEHPMHPYNNGQSAMGCLPCVGLGAREPDVPWYKSPMWILAGVGVLMYYMS